MSLIKRYLVVIAVGIGALFGCVVAYLALTTPVRRFPVGFAAAGGGEAVLLSRFSNYGDSRVFVDLVGPEGSRWSQETTPVFLFDVAGWSGAAATDDLVLVLGVDRRDVQWVGALAKSHGQPRWWTPLGGEGGRWGGGRNGPSVLLDEQRAYIIHEVRDPKMPTIALIDERKDEEPLAERVDVVSLADGRLLWTYPGPSMSSKGSLDLRLVGERLIITHADGVGTRELNARSGVIVRTLELDAVLCASPRGIVGVRKNVASWLPYEGAAVPLALTDARFEFTTTCGFRGDDLVLSLQRAGAWSVARVDLASGQPKWERALGSGPSPMEPVVLDATLPQVMPLVLCAREPYPGRCDVITVDLDAGSLLGRRRTPRIEEVVTPLVTAERAWLWLPTFELLVALDGHGQPSGAFRFTGLGVRELAADDVRDGRLWLAGRVAARPGEVPWAAFDLARDAVVAVHGDLVVDDGGALIPQLLSPVRIQ